MAASGLRNKNFYNEEELNASSKMFELLNSESESFLLEWILFMCAV